MQRSLPPQYPANHSGRGPNSMTTFAGTARVVNYLRYTTVLYLVSYDLNRPRGEDAYPELINALRRDGAVRILFSEWLVNSNSGAVDVANHYLAHMDGNDGIFVTEVTTNTAWRTLQNESQVEPTLRSVRRAA